LEITADHAEGYYLIDQSVESSLTIELEDVPMGEYDHITLKVGVESSGVQQGAGGVLSQGQDSNDSDMFWNWDTGYQALKLEGQSPSNEIGRTVGELLDESIAHGFVFHIGGWATPNNNKEITIHTDPIEVSSIEKPEIHLVMDLKELVSNPTGLNGFYLLLHIGTHPDRNDKFYYRLEELIGELRKRGYRFELIGHQ
jgi:hypothetical protein